MLCYTTLYNIVQYNISSVRLHQNTCKIKSQKVSIILHCVAESAFPFQDLLDKYLCRWGFVLKLNANVNQKYHHHLAIISCSSSSSSSPLAFTMSSTEAPPSPSNDPKEESYKKWMIASPSTARWTREWSRTYLLACAAGLLVDPLFLYALSISGSMMCLFLDGWFAIAVTVLRCMVDCMHVCNIWVQLKMACGGVLEERESSGEEKCEKGLLKSLYVRSKNGLILDLFVIFPILQVRILHF